MAEFITASISGEKDIIRTLDALGPRVERRVMRTALTKAGRVIAKEIKTKLKGKGFKDTHGVLWRSIGVRVKTNRRTGITYAVIGPQRKKGKWIVKIRDKRTKDGTRPKAMTSQQAGRALLSGTAVGGLSAIRRGRSAGGKSMRRSFRDPVKYAHLIEFGTARSAKHPFMRPAWASKGGQTALRDITKTIRPLLDAEIRKLAKKGTR